MKKKYILILFIISSWIVYSKENIVYPNVNGAGDKLFGYAVLKLALENSGEDYTLELSKEEINNSRVRKLIKEKELTVSDFGTGAEFEEELLAVYFPIDMGLNGWRIFMIHKDNQSKIEKIKSIEELRKFDFGQGLGWSDTNILENAELRVYTAPYIRNLVSMTQVKRFDIFPLGINEAHNLLKMNKEYGKDLIIEKNIVLKYSFGRLFFVHKDNRKLRDDIYKGLVKSFENGSFLELFMSHESHKDFFLESNLDKRRIIDIDNPNITQGFLRIPDKYFFTKELFNKMKKEINKKSE